NNKTYVGVTTSTYSVKDTVADFGIPLSIGGGLMYIYDDRLTVFKSLIDTFVVFS
ncbi:hypothetical protein EZS27_030065, partial [termite gut metagenome]